MSWNSIKIDFARAVSFKMSSSQLTPTPARNLSKLIDLGMRIELTGVILLSRPWWNDNRWPHQKTSPLDDVTERNGT